MKCYCCSNEIDDKCLICPVCGLPIPRRSGGDFEQYDNMMKMLAEEYRKENMIGAKIGIYIYYFTDDENGDLIEAGREELILCDNLSELEIGKVKWNTKKMGIVDPGLPITISAFGKVGEIEKTWDIPMESPDTVGFWYVGIMAEEKMKFRIYVGDEKNHSISNSISMFD